jgi:hypothetical protein
MDHEQAEALETFKAGLRVLGRRVAKAAYEEGHVSHRADGDYKKTGGQWVKLPASARQGQAGGTPPAVKFTPEELEQYGKMSPARLKAALAPERYEAYRAEAKRRHQAHVEELRAKRSAGMEAPRPKTEGAINAEMFAHSAGRAPGVKPAPAPAGREKPVKGTPEYAAILNRQRDGGKTSFRMNLQAYADQHGLPGTAAAWKEITSRFGVDNDGNPVSEGDSPLEDDEDSSQVSDYDIEDMDAEGDTLDEEKD